MGQDMTMNLQLRLQSNERIIGESLSKGFFSISSTLANTDSSTNMETYYIIVEFLKEMKVIFRWVESAREIHQRFIHGFHCLCLGTLLIYNKSNRNK